MEIVPFSKVKKINVRTDQLLWIKETTHLKIQIRKSEAQVHGQKKTLIQSLEQFHAHIYGVYEKVMTHAMVSLEGVHKSKTFR